MKRVVIVGGGFAGLAVASRRHPSVGPPARFALHLVFLQAVVGILNVLARVPIELTALHSAMAAAIAICTGLLVRQALLSSRATSTRSAPVAARERAQEAA